jgi:YebC/PmpR family DNA-binding regulatory protein
MSGHSKWATIKRKKAATDAARGKTFTKVIKEITIAARQGGGDPEGNPRLRTAILAAKSVNMPAGNIDRAIKKGTGELGGALIEEAHYEGYAPGGVALLVEVATDNRNRTSGDIRSILTRYGGNMAEAGSVSYLFKPRGLIVVDKSAVAEDTLIEVALEAGADDVSAEGDVYEVLTPTSLLETVREALVARQIAIHSAEATKLASLTVPIDDSRAASVFRLIEALEDHDDVQKVYANYSVSDELLAKLAQ